MQRPFAQGHLLTALHRPSGKTHAPLLFRFSSTSSTRWAPLFTIIVLLSTLVKVVSVPHSRGATRGDIQWPLTSEIANATATSLTEHRAHDLWATVATTLLDARKFGPHDSSPSTDQMLTDFRHSLLHPRLRMHWYFAFFCIAFLYKFEVTILQQIPETARTHFIACGFYILMAVFFWLFLMVQFGLEAGITWIAGYTLELIFSVDNMFILHILFCTLATPRRLLKKVMSVGLLGSILFRFTFFIGLASILDRLQVISYIVGFLFMYCGWTLINNRDCETVEIMETTIVQIFRCVFGGRLGEFYDEEGESLVMIFKKRTCMTLLGVVLLCVLIANFFLSVDVVLTKTELLHDTYLNFSSSAMAMFAINSLFFVVRDVFNRFAHMKHGVALILLFLGAEMLLARLIYVRALLSCAFVFLLVLLFAGSSLLGAQYQKAVT